MGDRKKRIKNMAPKKAIPIKKNRVESGARDRLEKNKIRIDEESMDQEKNKKRLVVENYGSFLDDFYEDIRKAEMDYPEYKLTPLMKVANKKKPNFDRHRLYMLYRKLSSEDFDKNINSVAFSTISDIVDRSNRGPTIKLIKALIAKKPNTEILKIAKAKDSKIFTVKYIKDLDPEIKF